MKKRVVLYAVLCVLLWLTETVFRPFLINGVSPRYLLAAVICVAFLEDNRLAAVLGLVFGLACGFSSGLPFGLTAVLYGAAGYWIGKITMNGYGRAFFSSLVATSGVTLLADLAMAFVRVFGTGDSVWQTMYHVALPKFFMTVLATAVVFAAVFWISTSRLWRNVDEEY